MAILTQVGQFAANTGGTTNTVNCNFQGKAIILFNHGKTGNAESAGASFSIGFSDGTHHCDTGWSGDDAVATTNVGRSIQTTKALETLTNGNPGVGQNVTGVSFGASTFTITWSGTPVSAWLIDFILIGGSDVTNVFVGNDTMPTSTGTKSVTGPGFRGNFVLLLSSLQAATGGTTQGQGMIGAAVSSAKRWAYGWAVQDAQTLSANVNGQTIMRSDRVLVGQASSNNQVTELADFSQWTATGFDLSFTTVAAQANIFGYLVIQGGTWDCGTSAKPTGATTQIVTGETFKPLLLGLFTSSPTASNTNVSNAVTSMGASDGSNQCFANAFHNDAINTVAKSSGSASACLLERDGANNPSATFTSFNPDGWTITWGATGSARQVGWFTVGIPFKVPEQLDIHRSGRAEPHMLVNF